MLHFGTCTSAKLQKHGERGSSRKLLFSQQVCQKKRRGSCSALQAPRVERAARCKSSALLLKATLTFVPQNFRCSQSSQSYTIHCYTNFSAARKSSPSYTNFFRCSQVVAELH